MFRLISLAILFFLIFILFGCSDLPILSEPIESDNEKPVVIITYPTNSSFINSSNIIVYGKAYDATNESNVKLKSSGLKKVYISLDDRDFEEVEGLESWVKSLVGLNDGIHTIKVFAVDISNNSSLTQEVVFIIDTVKPDIIVNITNGNIIKSPFELIIEVIETNSGVSAINIGNITTNLLSGINQLSVNLYLSNGLNTLSIVVIDNANNTNKHNLWFIVDDIKPEVEIIYPSQDQNVIESQIEIRGVARDSRGIREVMFSFVSNTNDEAIFSRVSFDGINWVTNVSIPATGTYYILVYAIDIAGNYSITNITRFFVDNDLPIVSIVSPTNNQFIDDIFFDVSGGASDLGSGIRDVFLSVNDSSFSKVSGTVNWTTNVMLIDGTNIIRVYSVDNFGNSSLTQSVFLIVKEKPSVRILFPENMFSVLNNNVRVWGDSRDLGSGISEVKYRVDGSAFASANGKEFWNVDLVLSDGLHTVDIFAIDKSNNTSITQSVEFIVDTEQPIIVITNMLNNQFLDSRTFTVAGISYDRGSGIEKNFVKVGNSDFYEVMSTNINSTNYWFSNFTVSSDGSYEIVAKSLDKSGKYSVYYIVRINIDTQKPTVGVLNLSNYQYFSNENVVIQGESYDDNGIDKVLFSSDGVQFGEVLGKNSWTTNITLSLGTNVLYFFSVDVANNTSLTQTISLILDKTIPTNIISFPTNGYVSSNSTLSFSGVSIDNSGISKVMFSLDGYNYSVLSLSSNWITNLSNLPDGTNKFYVFSVDLAGNVSYTNEIVFEVYEKPVVLISNMGSVLTNILTSGGVTIGGTASDNSEVKKVYVSTNLTGPYYEATGTTNWSFTFRNIPEGNLINVYAYSQDGFTNYSSTNSISFRVDKTFLGFGQYDFWAGSIHQVYVKSSNNTIYLYIVATNLSNPVLNHFFVILDITNLNGYQPSSSGWCGDWLTGWGDFWFTNVAGINMDLIIWGNIDASGNFINKNAKRSNGTDVSSSVSYSKNGNVYSFTVPYNVIGASSGNVLNVYVFYGKAGQGSPGPGGMRSIFPSGVSTIQRGEWGSFVNSITNKSINYVLN